jgi:MFS transporter, DHA1 family, multidrug resistance protein
MTAEASGEGWRRNVWALALVVFVAFVGFQFFSPFLPLYIHELGVEDPKRIALWSGVIAAVTPAISGVLAPLFGRLADRFGRKVMLIRSLAGFIVLISVMGLVRSVEQLFLARLVMGFFAGFTPMAMALASVSAPPERTPVAIGMVQSAQLLSVAIGPAVGGYVASHLGIRYAFFVTAGMCALALVVLILLFEEVGAPSGRGPARPTVPLRRVFQYPNFAVVMTLLLVGQFIDRGLGLLVPLKVAHLVGIQSIAATSGVIISLAAMAATISANGAARLALGIPAGRLLAIGLVAGGPLCAAMGLSESVTGLLVLRTLSGLCLGGTITLAYTLGGLVTPAHERAAAFGWLSLGVQIGTALSPLATGALAAVSLSGAFVLDGAVAWAAVLLLVFGARDLMARRQRAEP